MPMDKRIDENNIWAREELDSPCVKICVIHPEERLCVGCLRSLEEIAQWSKITTSERRAIMAELPARAPRLRKRRGGRSARVNE
jgi:predicted Fe-S protein YdhL (DUF1289 family)